MRFPRLGRAGLALALFLAAAADAALPPNFSDELVAVVARPTAAAFLPDGRLLVAQQTGALRVIKNDVLLATPAINLGSRVCSNRERGLVGVGVDPDFATNRFVYLYYSFKKHGTCPAEQTTNPNIPVNRLSRFVMPPGSDQLDAASERILLDNIPSPGGYHNAGDIHFGPDGMLWVSIGDGGCDYAGNSGCQNENDASRDPHVLLGKIARITRDGESPPDNPFVGEGTARCAATGRTSPGMKCRETFAMGLRNPFRFAFDPSSAEPRFFINDVGGSEIEEINLGIRGADYGWNCREGTKPNNGSGPCNPLPPGLVLPLFSYAHRRAIPWSSGQGWPGGKAPANCHSVTGGTFVPPGLWPAYDGAYLWSDYVCGGIFALRPTAGSGVAASDFATALGDNSAVTLLFGPAGGAQALYYTTFADAGQVRRIRFTGGEGNHAPFAALTAEPSGGALPLTVAFDASGSDDPDAGDALQFLWSFGDSTASQTTSSPSVEHVYTKAGTFTASVRARDNHGALSAPASVVIAAGNTPPVPAILAPGPGDLFAVGDQILLHGKADDAEDGALPPAALSWSVLLHHNNDHTHPYLEPTAGDNVLLVTPPPEDLLAAEASFLEIRLAATDSLGLSATVSQPFQPKRVPVTLLTVPPGLQLVAGGVAAAAPLTVTSWEGYQFSVQAPTPQLLGGAFHFFQSWSDGGAASHLVSSVSAGSGGASYTATFGSPADSTLSLRSSRFKVAVGWRTGAGVLGAGHAANLTDDSGDFWFFSAENIELIVKVLDGCAVNGHYWLFAGGLTDVETTIVVTDTVTGAARTYVNPAGTAFRPLQDTAAFATCL